LKGEDATPERVEELLDEKLRGSLDEALNL
jgi:hypothetical protein